MAHSTKTTQASSQTPLDTKAVGAVVIGNALEFYDFISYSFFAKQIGDAYFPSDVPGASLLSSLLVFWIGFFTRPIGAVLIGAFGDRAGRKPAMLLTISLMAVGMLLLAATPGFRTIGWAAPVLVVIGRLVQGFALGGEVGPSTAFLLEAAPQAKRALYANWQLASQGLAQILAGAFGYAVTSILSEADVKAWGWRIPLALGIVIVPIGLVIRRHLPETAGHEEASTGEVLRHLGKDHRRLIVLGTFTIMASTVATYVLLNMPTYAATTLGLSLKISAVTAFVLGLTMFVFSLAGGWLADRIGRRPTMIVPRAFTAILAVPAFVWLVHAPSGPAILAVTVLVASLANLGSAGSIASIPESLPRTVRSAGLSVIYAIAVTVFGGSTQWVINKLIDVTGDKVAPAYYLAAVSVLGAIAAFMMPETKGRTLD